MFAHFTHETGHFCYIKNGGDCRSAEERSCFPLPRWLRKRKPRKGHPGHGQSLSLLQSELVGSNPTVTFRTGLQRWMKSVRPVLNQGFGATIRAINGMECNGGNSGAVKARIGYYRAYCGQLRVDPGPNLSC